MTSKKLLMIYAHPCPQLFPLAIAALGPTCACAATRTATDTSRSQASSKTLPCCLRQRCFPYIPYMYVVSTYIYIYYMHDKKSCGNITCMTMHDKKSCGILQLTASRTMLVYCCRTDTPGRASFSSLSSDASASTFAGRSDAVYGARRSVSGSSRKACECCVTLLDLCLFGVQLKHSRRCE